MRRWWGRLRHACRRLLRSGGMPFPRSPARRPPVKFHPSLSNPPVLYTIAPTILMRLVASSQVLLCTVLGIVWIFVMWGRIKSLQGASDKVKTPPPPSFLPCIEFERAQSIASELFSISGDHHTEKRIPSGPSVGLDDPPGHH